MTNSSKRELLRELLEGKIDHDTFLMRCAIENLLIADEIKGVGWEFEGVTYETKADVLSQVKGRVCIVLFLPWNTLTNDEEI